MYCHRHLGGQPGHTALAGSISLHAKASSQEEEKTEKGNKFTLVDHGNSFVKGTFAHHQDSHLLILTPAPGIYPLMQLVRSRQTRKSSSVS